MRMPASTCTSLHARITPAAISQQGLWRCGGRRGRRRRCPPASGNRASCRCLGGSARRQSVPVSNPHPARPASAGGRPARRRCPCPCLASLSLAVAWNRSPRRRTACPNLSPALTVNRPPPALNPATCAAWSRLSPCSSWTAAACSLSMTCARLPRPTARSFRDAIRRSSNPKRLALARSKSRRAALSALVASPHSCGRGSAEPVRLSHAPLSSLSGACHRVIDSPSRSQTDTLRTTARHETSAAVSPSTLGP